MGEIISFKRDLPIERILEGAKKELSGVILIGYTNDGEEYFASTYSDGGEIMWLVERFKNELLSMSFSDV